MTDTPAHDSGEHFPDDGQVEFETEKEGTGPAETPAGPTPADGVDPEELLNPSAETLIAQVEELTSDLQRLQAEYVNYKRRVDRDRELVLQNAKFQVLASLLPVLDDIERARGHEELTGGFKAVADALARVVEQAGLEKFGTPGDDFDPRLHEALMHRLSPDATTTTCETIVQSGYQYGDRVMRPARVTVVDPDPSAG